jgi:hypothetical protein
VWEYDDEKMIQTLAGLEIHCSECDRVTHLGRTGTLGQPELVVAALARLGRINGWAPEQVRAYRLEAREQWRTRSAHEWTQDISWYERWLAGWRTGLDGLAVARSPHLEAANRAAKSANSGGHQRITGAGRRGPEPRRPVGRCRLVVRRSWGTRVRSCVQV